jgi:hypothetical protein
LIKRPERGLNEQISKNVAAKNNPAKSKRKGGDHGSETSMTAGV